MYDSESGSVQIEIDRWFGLQRHSNLLLDAVGGYNNNVRLVYNRLDTKFRTKSDCETAFFRLKNASPKRRQWV